MEETPAEHAAPKARSKQRSKLWLLLGGALALIGVACLAITFLLLRADGSKAPDEFKKAQSAVSFPVYYPQDPPNSLRFNETSLSYTKDVVLYTYTYDGNKIVSISVQAKAGGFSDSDFNPTTEFTSHMGRAYIADLDHRTSAAVVGDKSWVLINAPNGIADSTLRDFIDSLRPVNQ